MHGKVYMAKGRSSARKQDGLGQLWVKVALVLVWQDIQAICLAHILNAFLYSFRTDVSDVVMNARDKETSKIWSLPSWCFHNLVRETNNQKSHKGVLHSLGPITDSSPCVCWCLFSHRLSSPLPGGHGISQDSFEVFLRPRAHPCLS